MAGMSRRGGRIGKLRRAAIKDEFWPRDKAWLGHAEIGYFCAPRSLPLLLRALNDPRVSGNRDAGTVYLGLLASHMGEGVVEIVDEDALVFAAGYSSARAWRERMKVLEDAGFVKAVNTGNRRYGKVLLVHPSQVMRRLHNEKKIPDALWQAYRNRQIESVGSAGDSMGADSVEAADA